MFNVQSKTDWKSV